VRISETLVIEAASGVVTSKLAPQLAPDGADVIRRPCTLEEIRRRVDLGVLLIRRAPGQSAPARHQHAPVREQ